MNPVVFLPMVMLGAALIWSVHLAYGTRRGAADDALKLCMTIGGWLLVLLGGSGFIMGFASGPLMIMVPVYWLVVLATLHRYRDAERQALIWTLAHAAKRGVPLADAARSFAQERTDEIGSRSWRLATALEAGMPLDVALLHSANTVPLHVLVAARVGTTYDKLPEALFRAVSQSRDFDRLLRTILERLIFMLVCLSLFLMLTAFIMLKIIPTFERMFYEFELELPTPTKLVIALSQVFVSYSPWLLLFIPPLVACLVMSGLYYVGWLPWNMPGTRWLRVRYDRTILLRSLALAVERQQSFEQALHQLQAVFPTYGMRRRMERVLRECRQGGEPLVALRRAGLLTRYEQAVLAAAQRVGNLAWALDVMADTAVRRLTERMRRLSSIVLFMLFVTFSTLVLLLSVGMMMPLASLILNLS